MIVDIGGDTAIAEGDTAIAEGDTAIAEGDTAIAAGDTDTKADIKDITNNEDDIITLLGEMRRVGYRVDDRLKNKYIAFELADDVPKLLKVVGASIHITFKEKDMNIRIKDSLSLIIGQKFNDYIVKLIEDYKLAEPFNWTAYMLMSICIELMIKNKKGGSTEKMRFTKIKVNSNLGAIFGEFKWAKPWFKFGNENANTTELHSMILAIMAVMNRLKATMDKKRKVEAASMPTYEKCPCVCALKESAYKDSVDKIKDKLKQFPDDEDSVYPFIKDIIKDMLELEKSMINYLKRIEQYYIKLARNNETLCNIIMLL